MGERESGAGGRVMLVEDEAATRGAVADLLRELGHVVFEAANGQAAIDHVERTDVEVVVLDLGLPDLDGLEVLPRLLEIDESLAVIVMTGRGSIETVVEAMKLGAESFLVKPVDVETLDVTVRQAVRQHRLSRHASVYAARVGPRPGDIGPGDLVGSSPGMLRVRELIARVAGTDASVVLTGESGTGKGVVARLIHRHSRRPQGPFVDLSCAALPGSLVESEIFGHERGAFTDARQAKPGMLEVANGGTLFLDEIAELEAPAQAKLLKAIEHRTFRRVGGVRDLTVDVRLIVATHRDLAALVAAGQFRADLYFRLNVFQIEMPPLRERGEDVIELAQHFIAELNPRLGRRVRRLAQPAARALVAYAWPGNVRELHNVIERAMILATGEELALHHFPHDLWATRQPRTEEGLPTLAEMEAEHIRAVMAACEGNIKLAARKLGISRSTLYLKLGRHGLRSTPG
ncbi:MAG TPA: sigma-54 dependent transcriptional regulator [Thermoanaerobaculaceae bacterium]|nr:sigma-54 dependent transcriptional regulator [Thermoanaerobaculaceae bacterium]HRS15940.1 sigma-54 dependent transcriptional regulator [Thermoanaerobaculaceae bacterium]